MAMNTRIIPVAVYPRFKSGWRRARGERFGSHAEVKLWRHSVTKRPQSERNPDPSQQPKRTLNPPSQFRMRDRLFGNIRDGGDQRPSRPKSRRRRAGRQSPPPSALLDNGENHFLTWRFRLAASHVAALHRNSLAAASCRVDFPVAVPDQL